MVDQLTDMYPKLPLVINDKSLVNSELDIYLPSLNLAFELNGVFHYLPIYGEEKLKQIQSNDNDKAKLCADAGIELVAIDISSQKNFTPRSSLSFLEEIVRIVDVSLAPSGDRQSPVLSTER